MCRLRDSILSVTILIVMLLVSTGCEESFKNEHFEGTWSDGVDRVWLGPDYWANPLQDWRIKDGRLECIVSGGDRNIYLLSRKLRPEHGYLKMSVELGELTDEQSTEGWAGFKVGVRGDFDDYRDSAVRGDGFKVGILTNGSLFVGQIDPATEKITVPLQDIKLIMTATPSQNYYTIKLLALDKNQKLLSQVVRKNISPDWLLGGVSLVCSAGKFKPSPETRPAVTYGNWGFRPGTERQGNVRFWFSDWKVTGSKVKICQEQEFGPILFNQYTISDGIMKMTAQMAPIGPSENQIVELQIKKNFNWATIDKTGIDPLSRTATFRIENWNTKKNIPYRLAYSMLDYDGTVKDCYYTGTIRRQPTGKKDFVVAAFTGNNDLGFPNTDIFKQVKFHNPDLLFFSGDQIYEGVGGYGIQTEPVETAALDYLRKWYLYGWAYGELMRNRPTVAIPDDHDVYHGNLWGAGGKPTDKGLSGAQAQDSGGYKLPPEWVNMVQRTQTSHLPDPFEPSPVEQGIGVYYCNMNYGGLSFAIIEDRKFKSAPKVLLPEAKIWNGFPQNKDFDVRNKADVTGAKLLGDRQVDFLDKWSNNWSEGIWMKVVLSQTIFANVATLPNDENNDQNVPALRILPPDVYAENDAPVTDFDSNGWPQTGRNKALEQMRRCFAFHIAGDQHLGSTIQYGINDWHDAGFALCVPSVSNVWPRRWYPSNPGLNRKPDSPKYTGDFEDGFGNKITVHAVSNPVFTGLEPAALYDRATGYGIVRFNKNSRDITIECWPRLDDPSKSDAKQYPGWPITINQAQNYDRKSFGYLPTIETNIDNPIVQIINEEKDEIVYTIRIKGRTFEPKIFENGTYTIHVGPSSGNMKTIKGIGPQEKPYGLAKFEF